MGCVGNLAIAVVLPWMGGINDQITFAAIPAEIQQSDRGRRGASSQDKVKTLPPEQQTIVTEAQKEGAKWSFRYVSALPVILIFIFGGIALSRPARAGLQARRVIARQRSCRPRSSPRTISWVPALDWRPRAAIVPSCLTAGSITASSL